MKGAAHADNAARRDRLIKRWAGIGVVLMLINGAVSVWPALNLTTRTAEQPYVTMTPADPAVYAYGVASDEQMTFTLSETPDLLQTIGIGRKVTLKLEATFMVTRAAGVAAHPESFNWDLETDLKIHKVRGYEPPTVTEVDGTNEFSWEAQPWEDLPSRVALKPLVFGLTPSVITQRLPDGSAEDIIMVQFDMLIDPPVSESYLSTDRVWTQSWALTWKPPTGAEDINWYANGRGGDDWYQDGDLVNGEHTTNASVDVAVCSSCGITKMYGDGKEMAKGSWVDTTPFATEHTFEFATNWRPFDTAWGFTSITFLALMAVLLPYLVVTVGRRKPR